MTRLSFPIPRARSLWLALLILPLVALRAESLPKWLQSVTAKPVTSQPEDVPAEVLLDETVLTVDAGGDATWERHYAVKILNRSGAAEANGGVYYLDKKDRVSDAAAWLLRNGETLQEKSGSKWSDISAAAEGAIYDETRVKQISFRDEAAPGDIFACETQVEGPMVFAQEIYGWGNPLPAAVERYVVKVPSSWSVTGLVRGQVQPVATVSPDKRVWTWELQDRAYRPHEPWMDQHSVLEAQLMVNLVPPGGAKAGMPPAFHTWSEMADWEQGMVAGQCDTDPSLVAATRRLVAVCPTEIEKIRALSSYVQKLRYVAVNRNLARGQGYRPRKATEVFTKGFGDCKDKSNLLRAMLREVGIQSYPVTALASEEREVYADWPSPMQFNHAILAIQVDQGLGLPSVVPTPQWGSLLFFDATDPETLLGDLPWYLQGSQVHVVAPGSDGLIRLPDLSVERRWLAERHVKLELKAKGTVSGECRLAGFAQQGAQMRRFVRNSTAKELHDWATARINSALNGVAVQNVLWQDDAVTGQFDLTFSFPETAFAQLMPGGLAVVRLDILTRDTIPKFAEKERRTPIELRPVTQDDEVELLLPPGLAIDELPTKTVLDGPFGSYENSFEAWDRTIVFHRKLKLKPLVVAVADYPKLRQFLSSASKADRGAIVLRAAN